MKTGQGRRVLLGNLWLPEHHKTIVITPINIRLIEYNTYNFFVILGRDSHQ